MAYTSFAQDNKSGVSSTLREMYVMYEDQFNTHTNKWPEY